jgi:CRP-like cAMP-binding protein
MQIMDRAQEFVSKYITLNEEEFMTVVRALEIREFGKKQLLTRQGEVEQYLNFVAQGLARKFFYKNKEEMVTHIAKENEIICCYESFTACTPSAYVIETIEPTAFISISRQKLEDIYLAVPKMERLARMVITEQFIANEHWEFDRVRYGSRERFIQFVKENSDLLQRVPQKFLASYLNIKPETFSRLKHLLKRA